MADINQGKLRTANYLRLIGVTELPPSTSPFDPGYDPVTLDGHLAQSSHLVSMLKLSMACWLIADEDATRRKVASAVQHGVSTVAGGGPFEIAVAQNRLAEYLELCADIGFTRVEAGAGFTNMALEPAQVVAMTRDRGLQVQFELGRKHDGAFTHAIVAGLVVDGHRWLEAGAEQLVIEARESAQGVGLFDQFGALNVAFAEQFIAAFGFAAVVFEAPNKASQFALLNHFGPQVQLCNVRLEELLRVEIYRRGLHSDAFRNKKLRPSEMKGASAAEESHS